MDTKHRIVTSTPLTELWTETGPLQAKRLGEIGAEHVRLLLRDGTPQFVVADAGMPLRWVPVDDRFRFWKEEAAPRLVAPNAQAFHPEEFPGAYCLMASEWRAADGTTVVLLERYH